MMAFVITEVLLEKLGGDSVEEMLPRFASLRRSRVSDVPVNNVSWRFGYV
jgi:chorismate synthase